MSVHVPGIEVERGRRAKIVQIDAGLIEAMLTQTGEWSDHVRVQAGLPVGVRLVHVDWHPTGRVDLIFEHDSFPMTLYPTVEPIMLQTNFCGHKPQA